MTWIEYPEEISEVIECKYQDYLDNQNDSEFQTYQLEEIGYEINFFNREQISLEDNTLQRSLDRFKGDPNLNDKLRNLIIILKYR
jgi:hypothetical protein